MHILISYILQNYYSTILERRVIDNYEVVENYGATIGKSSALLN